MQRFNSPHKGQRFAFKPGKLAAAIIVASAILSGCGSSGGGGGGSGGGKTPGPGNLTDPKDPGTCAAIWQEYVATHPQGLSLTYETIANDYTSRYTEDVIESNASRVTTRVTSEGATDETTTTREEFLQTCGQGIPNDPVATPDMTIEEKRKESKTVRAGTFATQYIRARIKSDNGNGGQNETVSEMWHTTDATNILVYSRNAMNFGDMSFNSTTELVEIRRP